MLITQKHKRLTAFRNETMPISSYAALPTQNAIMVHSDATRSSSDTTLELNTATLNHLDQLATQRLRFI